MKRAEFDWDKYLSTAKYAEVVANSPDLSSRRPPTLYSPDRSWLYLSSQDVAVETDDTNGLKAVLQHLSTSYKNAKASEDYKKIAGVKLDYFEVCELLQELVDTPEDYDDPDSLLNT